MFGDSWPRPLLQFRILTHYELLTIFGLLEKLGRDPAYAREPVGGEGRESFLHLLGDSLPTVHSVC